MIIREYERVLLKSGCEASIIEILEEGKMYLADIDRDGDTDTEEISADEIEAVISKW